MKNPYAMLHQAEKILKKGGLFYIHANQYRSAIASHLYRQIYFPWPHLIFEDDIVIKFALASHVLDSRALKTRESNLRLAKSLNMW
jgi:hypothetical protein